MSLDVLYLSWNRWEFTDFTLRLLVENTDWSLVDRLIVADDASERETQQQLSRRVAELSLPIPFEYWETNHGSPVGVMRAYVANRPADLFAKIDNDVCVPPGWLNVLTDAMAKREDLELLGMEAGMVGLDAPGRGIEPCTHIGGVGLMRSSAFRKRPQLKPVGRFGFTEWQHRHQPTRAWIKPDLLVPCLDRLPHEPWLSLSAWYRERGWQREWQTYHPVWGRQYFGWLPEPGFTQLEAAERFRAGESLGQRVVGS